MRKGEQQKIFHKGSNAKVNALITLIYPLNKVKFKISKSRTSNDFIDHLISIKHYVIKNKIKRFILVTDNASFHVSRKTKQFVEKQSNWLTVIFLPKRSPNLNPVGFQNRSFTNKRVSESSRNSTAISTALSNHCFYYNCKTRKEHPKAIKHMLGS